LYTWYTDPLFIYAPSVPVFYSVIEAMPLEEQQNSSNLEEIITPFLTETGETTEEEAIVICRKIAVSFGSSGMSNGTTVFTAMEDMPGLLSNAVRIIDNSEETGLVLNPNATYGSVMIGGGNGSISGSNTAYDSKAIPTTLREARKMKRTQAQMNELLEREKAKQSAARQEVINARMKVCSSCCYFVCLFGVDVIHKCVNVGSPVSTRTNSKCCQLC